MSNPRTTLFIIHSLNTMKKPILFNSDCLLLSASSSVNFFKLSLTGLLLSCLTPGNALAIPPKAFQSGNAFAQLSSALDQRPGGWVKFESKDTLQRMSATEDSVMVKQRGSYLIIASPQVTATKDGGCVDAWISINGQDVKNSGVRLCQSKAGNTDVVVSQVIMNLKTGDKIQVKSSGDNVKLDAIKPDKGPLIPSIILTVVGID
jgi:hypothetical protein